MLNYFHNFWLWFMMHWILLGKSKNLILVVLWVLLLLFYIRSCVFYGGFSIFPFCWLLFLHADHLGQTNIIHLWKMDRYHQMDWGNLKLKQMRFLLFIVTSEVLYFSHLLSPLWFNLMFMAACFLLGYKEIFVDHLFNLFLYLTWKIILLPVSEEVIAILMIKLHC